ncbi:UV-B-induced protein At3g17800, chloroplastic [Impatiens glandulifera]|uniref:UV-B-induced protein At3g17800, chloroplastic n=1 Tax=Impatiens glandulifera TaxID=253017 RepID=UPI001FB0588F|nr:UV-B-induced protein At3g17800, chloroplastic [Impatiens glandulifera]
MQVSGVLSDVSALLPFSGGYNSSNFRHSRTSSYYKLSPSIGFSRSCSSYFVKKLGFKHESVRGLTLKATSDPGGELDPPIAPVQFDSPIGQLLGQILQTHPHLLSAAVDQHLENLQSERESQQEETQPSPQDLLLYKRIAEVKEKERKNTLEEILYCLIVHKFVDKEIKMIPKISVSSDPTLRVDLWPNQELKLESVHSQEAFEMIQSHLSLVLGDRLVGPLDSIVQMSKIKLGKLYAASVMYGYFLKRVDERYQLEQSMNTLNKNLDVDRFKELSAANPLWDPDSLITIRPDDDDYDGNEDRNGTFRLRSYVMYLDTETLQRYATIRSKESISLIEKQTQALFGRPDIRINEEGSLESSNDEIISLSFSGLTMLVLEAVAFGSFLWEAENYVESKYQFINS